MATHHLCNGYTFHCSIVQYINFFRHRLCGSAHWLFCLYVPWLLRGPGGWISTFLPLFLLVGLYCLKNGGESPNPVPVQTRSFLYFLSFFYGDISKVYSSAGYRLSCQPDCSIQQWYRFSAEESAGKFIFNLIGCCGWCAAVWQRLAGSRNPPTALKVLSV